MSNSDFYAGVCVALQTVVQHGEGTIWRNIVQTVGEAELLQYAANTEPDEWEIAGFAKYARNELGRNRPRKTK